MGSALEEFYAELERRRLVVLWRVVRGLMPSQPQSRFVPHLWRWKDLQALATSAAELVVVDRAAERRVLGLENPGVPGSCAATPSGPQSRSCCRARWRPRTGTRRARSGSSFRAKAPTQPSRARRSSCAAATSS